MIGENIFLDTSIFVKENFLDSKRINQFLDISAMGNVKLILSRITVNEIKARFRKQALVALEKHNTLINDKNIAVLRNSSKEGHLIKKFSSLKVICEEFDTRLEERLSQSKALIIEYPLIDSAPLFKKYFEGTFPFSKGEKKHEFPDAVALFSIEQWCAKNKTSVTIFSKDKDFLNSKPAEGVNVEDDFEKYLEALLIRFHPARMALAEELFGKNNQLMNQKLVDWVTDELSDDSIYDDFTNWLEVHDVNIRKVEVVEKRHQVISVDDEMIEFEVIATVQAEVILTFDNEETGIWDSEDKVMLFRETIKKTVRQELEIPFHVLFSITDINDYYEDGEVININDGKSIKLEVEDWN